MNWGEKVVQISAGRDHLLAVTNKGRTLGHAVSEAANTNKQLVDLQEIVLPKPTTLNREKEKNERFSLMYVVARAPNYVSWYLLDQC